MNDEGMFDMATLPYRKHEFMRALEELDHAVITQGGQPIVFVHRVNSAASAVDIARQAYDTGISPEPGEEPLAAHSVDRYWDTLAKNITDMTEHLRSVTLLTKDGRVVAVLQNLVPNITDLVPMK